MKMTIDPGTNGTGFAIWNNEGILKEYGVVIPVVGVVKDTKHRPREIRGDRQIFGGLERDILLANAEAHRFAITYHRARSRKALTSS